MKNIIDILNENKGEVQTFFIKEYSKNLNSKKLAYMFDNNQINEVINSLFLINFLLNFNESSIEKPAFIIGANGSGKSKLIEFLTTKIFHKINIKVIKANTELTLDYENTHYLNRKMEDIKVNNYFIGEYIVALMNDRAEHIEELRKNNKSWDHLNTKLNKIITIFEKIFPEFKIDFEITDKNLIFSKSGSPTFQWNDLSDGEKKVLWMLMQIISSDKDSWIFIDEPETHLNPAIFKRLWLEITAACKECKFIFITHSPEMINIFKYKAEFFRINKFTFPKLWDIRKIDFNNLEPEWWIKIYGTKQKILFCEGKQNTEKNLDFKVYNQLFEDCQVVPINGKNEVIAMVSSINKNKFYNLEAFGIIDKDTNIWEEQPENTKPKIFKLKDFNEIEMLLLCDTMIMAVLQDLNCLWDNKKLNQELAIINDNFFNCCKNNIDKIIDWNINEIINKTKKQHPINISNVDSISTSIKQLEVKVIKHWNEISKKKNDVLELINSKKKSELLKICNLKWIISDPKIMKIKDYENHAINVLGKNKNLREDIKKILDINFDNHIT